MQLKFFLNINDFGLFVWVRFTMRRSHTRLVVLIQIGRKYIKFSNIQVSKTKYSSNLSIFKVQIQCPNFKLHTSTKLEIVQFPKYNKIPNKPNKYTQQLFTFLLNFPHFMTYIKYEEQRINIFITITIMVKFIRLMLSNLFSYKIYTSSLNTIQRNFLYLYILHP